MEPQDDIQPESESNYQSRLDKIESVKLIDQKFGFKRYTDPEWRNAWLINVHQGEMVDDESKVIVAVCDFYFLQENGGRFKISYPFRPYFYLATIPTFELQVSSFLTRKYTGIITVDVVEKEDLDLKNHLSGLKRSYLKVTFPSLNELQKFKRDLTPILRRNQEREKASSSYTHLLAKHLGAVDNPSDDGSVLEKVIDMREHDLPYQMRVCIDLEIFVGSWYRVIGRSSNRYPKIERHPTLIDPPEPIILAYDIEVTKLPLKFPDSASDEIMMISYMVNGDGFLIINRRIVSDDVEDFEYTPKPEYKGLFRVINVENEVSVIKYFFDHILRVKPLVFVTYNGDSFDWPFVEARAKVHGLNMASEIGFAKNSTDEYRSTNAVHLDAYKWVKRDSYLPIGSQNLKACTKAKLRYDPVELDPEQMCVMAKEQPQTLANYSVSDAVATYYLYIKYVHPFIFALSTIIPLGPDDVLRKGSGTLCEALLMVNAFKNNIIFPNKSIQQGTKYTSDGHAIESETYVGGHVEALQSGIFRADIHERFRVSPAAVKVLKNDLTETLKYSLTQELRVDMNDVVNFDDVVSKVSANLDDFINRPHRFENPKIYHLDVGAMYPNIILTNRLQPPAVVTEEECIACDYNTPDARCQRKMNWEWRGEIMPATKGEYERIIQQLENERFGKPPKPFHTLSREIREQTEKKRIRDFCKRAYGKTHMTRTQIRQTTICERENGFYVDTVKAFRDRRYEYKALLKKAKAALEEVREDDITALKMAQARVVLYESLQLAHKCILNSFYGYVMRRGSRWFSMEMAGIVCHTGANIIREARKLIESIGTPLELDTDGIWCLIPSTFPENITFTLKNDKPVIVSYPGAILNALVRYKFTNDQYHELNTDGTYNVRPENSIFFEVDGPYHAMILPASREEGKKLKKRYAVFNFDGSIAELKGFEIKRRGELALIKYFQSSVFKAFLNGTTREEAYESAAKEANYWLDVLFSKGENCSDAELFDLISENRSMSKKLGDYGDQKSTSISTAKRLAEFLGDDMVKDAGLACKFIISRQPLDDPVAQRAIPLVIFQAPPNVAAHYLRKWTKDMSINVDNVDIRNIIDWNYYIERFGSTVQKIISIPAALQNIPNPVPRVPFPDWLENRRQQRANDHKQPKINTVFKKVDRPPPIKLDIEDTAQPISAQDDDNGLEEHAQSNEESSEVLRQKAAKRKRSSKILPTEVLEESMPKKTIAENGVIEWIRYLKWKWKKQRREKKQRETIIAGVTPIQSMLMQSKKLFKEAVWHVIKICESQTRGVLFFWALINGKIMKISVRVPRIVYINDRKDDSRLGVLVKRALPHMKPVHNLRRCTIDETKFESSLNHLNRELCAMRIDGIYESQVTPLCRAVIELGSSCRLKPEVNTFSMNSIEFDQLEQDFTINYLPDGCVRRLFFYEHHQDKRCMMGLFDTDSKQAIIAIINKTPIDLPNISNIFNAERARLDDRLFGQFSRCKEPLQMDVNQCTTSDRADRIIQKFLRGLRPNETTPVFVMVQTQQTLATLVRRIPALDDCPLIRIRATEPRSLFSVLEWQRVALTRLMKHYFNSYLYLHFMAVSRFLHVPLGNIPLDIATFAPDILYARSLMRSGYVLWISPTTRPDLGGKELDDARLNIDWSELHVSRNPTAVINRPCFETDVCVELEIGAVEVTAVLQSAKIADAEGAPDSVGFATGSTLASDKLLGHVKSIANYDESAAVAAPLKVLRTLMTEVAREIKLCANKIADEVVINLGRWVRTQNALLYDPAIVRVVDMLVTKLILLFVTEIERLGGKVIYATSARVVVCTRRSCMESAQAFFATLRQSFADDDLFGSLNINPTNYFNVLLWEDINDNVGIKLGESAQEDRVVARLSTCNALKSDVHRKLLKQLVVGYVALVGESIRSRNSIEEQQKYRERLILSEISTQMFELVTRFVRYGSTDDPDHMTEQRDSLLLLIKAVTHFIALDNPVNRIIAKLKYQLLRALNVNDSSAAATWCTVNASCTIKQMFCPACSQCNDLDVYSDDDWCCRNCRTPYSLATIECQLIERVNQLISAYTIQDFKCTRCGLIRRHSLSTLCECCGVMATTIARTELEFSLQTIKAVAQRRDLEFLAELCEWTLAY